MFEGYKCFNKGLVNRYGFKFEEEKIYHCEGEIKFGNDGNGFHVCKRLEDTLRYFDAMNGEIDICEVNCYGNSDEGKDDYNEYYDMYAYEYMVIKKILSREEIIDYAIKLNEIRAKRFISLFKLTDEEIVLFKEKFKKNNLILNTIAYYQEGNKDAYNNSYVKKRIL